jgi:hypothetical protein
VNGNEARSPLGHESGAFGGLGRSLGSFHDGIGGGSGFFGEVEVTSAIAAKANVRSAFQAQHDADGDAHVTGGAGLVAQKSDTSFTAVDETLIMSQDGRGDLGAQFLDQFLGVRFNSFFKFEGLQLE